MKFLVPLILFLVTCSSVVHSQDVFTPPVPNRTEVDVVPLAINTNDDDFAPVALMVELEPASKVMAPTLRAAPDVVVMSRSPKSTVPLEVP